MVVLLRALLSVGACSLAALASAAIAAPAQSATDVKSCDDACYEKCDESRTGRSACKNDCGLRCLLTSSASPAVALSEGAPPPLSSCDKLFSRLRAEAARAPASVQWSTSYLTNGLRFMGVTALNLSPHNADLVGGGRRLQLSSSSALRERRADEPETESVTPAIRADGRIVFNNIYGPYDVLCTGERFALVLTGDSVEVFNFMLPGS